MDWYTRNSTKIVIVEIIASFLFGAAIAIHGGSLLRYPDEREWVQLATNLVNQHIFTFDGINTTALRPPGFPFVLLLPVASGIGNVGLRFVNLGIFVFTEIMLVLLAQKLFSRSAAAISVFLVLLYPVLAYSATLLLPQTLGAALLLLGTWLLIRHERPRALDTALGGVVWGFLLLTIPTFAFVMGWFVLWLLWRRPGFRRTVIFFVATLFLVVGAWTARNYNVFHAVFFVATNGGSNLLKGNSENSTVDSDTLTDVKKYVDATHGMSETQSDKFYKTAALTWMKEHPGVASRLYAAKVMQYFWFTERTATENYATRFEQPIWRTLIMLFTYEPLLLLLLARFAIARKYPLSELEILFAGLYFINAPFAAIFYSRIRYRLPMDWILLLLDAGMVQIVLSRLFSRKEASGALTHGH